MLGKLARFGLEASAEEVFTAVPATVRFLREKGNPCCYCLVRDSIRPLLAEFPEDDTAPNCVVGDDIDSAIGGAQNAGLRGVLVRAGKYRQAYVEASAIDPEVTIDSIADLPGLLE